MIEYLGSTIFISLLDNEAIHDGEREGGRGANAADSSGRSLRLLLSNSLRDEVLREEPAPISMKPS